MTPSTVVWDQSCQLTDEEGGAMDALFSAQEVYTPRSPEQETFGRVQWQGQETLPQLG